jgi:hypothetical protein
MILLVPIIIIIIIIIIVIVGSLFQHLHYGRLGEAAK